MKKTIPILLLSFLSYFTYAQCTCLEFDGVDDYTHSDFNDYDFSNFTIETWINVPDFNTNIHYVSLYQGSYLVLGDYGSQAISTWANGLSPIDAGPNTFQPTVNEWHHFAFVYDGTNQYLYVDGILDLTVPTSGSVNTFDGNFDQGLNLMARYTGSSQFRSGFMDETRIWNVARTGPEINASMSSELTGNETGLVAYYQFEDGTGSSTVTDITGNGNDLTLTNMDPNSDWVSDCPFNAVAPIPTLSQWGIFILFLLLSIFAVGYMTAPKSTFAFDK